MTPNRSHEAVGKPSPSSSLADGDAAAQNPEFQRFFMYLVTAFTAIGGFLFGYDTGVISGALRIFRFQFQALMIAPGAMLYVKKEYVLDDPQQELVVSMALVGAAAGALFAGVLADRLGRRVAVCWQAYRSRVSN